MKVQLYFLFSLVFLLRMEVTKGSEFIRVGDELGLNQSLASKNGVFKMGFWSPSGSRDYYLSIWYAAIPLDENAIIWTAITPCAEQSCGLELSSRKGLVIHGTNWTSSANVKGLDNAKLTDKGNLVVLGTNGSTIWESFEYPTNILVPGQTLKPGQSLHSWNSQNDPSRGIYSVRVERGKGFSLYNNTSCISTLGANGLPGDLYGEFLDNRRSNLLLIYGANQRIVAFRDILNSANASAPARIHLTEQGVLNLEIWGNGSWNYSWNQTFIISHDTESPPTPRGRPLLQSIVNYVVGFLLLIIVLLSLSRKCRERAEGLRNGGSSAVPTRFDYKVLKMATDDFKEKLGRGGFGSVYKGILPDKTIVAVKKLDCSGNCDKGFENEVMSIGSIHHLNLVRLIGYCAEGKDMKLLVYEYMENGSLDKHLFNRRYSVVPWHKRFKIALGVAKGLAYCHDQCISRIVHCDLKPHNVLLDSHMEPKISDFGLAKLMARDESGILTIFRGTRGYCAPEWLREVPITVKADVYSYGQMLFELISGRRNLNTTITPERQYYPCWAFNQIREGNAASLVDVNLGKSVDVDQVKLLFKVAFWCIQDDYNIRPSMAQVVQMIEGSVQVEMPPRPKNLMFQVDFQLTSDPSS